MRWPFSHKVCRRTSWYAATLVWLLACAAGLGWLMQYQNRPGLATRSPQQWPRDSKISPAADRTTLVMFVHPHCPCSRASLDELERIVAQSAGKIASRIVFFRPRSAEAGWEQTDLWRTAAALPDVQLMADVDGAEARRFAASTSGHAELFDRQGKLLFSGGITLARGHSGDNPGHTAVVSLAKEIPSECRLTPVFGCPLTSATTSATAPLESR